jgi:hypothetical protein
MKRIRIKVKEKVNEESVFRLFFIIFLALVSCNKYCVATISKVWLEKISWSAHVDANDGIPIKMHLVYFYDEPYMKKIMEKDSKEYFENFEMFEKDFAGKVHVISFDVIPGESHDDIDVLPKKCDAKGAVIFARYNAIEKSQKYSIAEDSEIRLIFKKDSIEIIED